MKKKITIIAVSLVAIIAMAATFGITYALWDPVPADYTYTVNTKSNTTVEIGDMVMDSTKLAPGKTSSTNAVPAYANINIKIIGNDCRMKFEILKIEYLDKTLNEWCTLPTDVLQCDFMYNGSKVTDKAPPFKKGNHMFQLRALFKPVEDLLDPVYRDTSIRFSARITATVVE